MSLEDGKYLRRRRRKVIDVRGRESSLDGGGAESGLSESGEEEERKRVTEKVNKIKNKILNGTTLYPLDQVILTV